MKDKSHPTKHQILKLLLKGFSITAVSTLTHPLTYPISASALLCQANVLRSGSVFKIVFYAFHKAQSISLFHGGGLASLLKTFTSVVSVAVEDIWLALTPLQLNKEASLFVSRLVGLCFNIAVSNPLDVIRTRLALEEFGSRPNPTPSGLISEYRKILSMEGRSALYSGWQIIVVQYVLDYLFQVWGKHTTKKKKASVLQLLPLLVQFFMDYAFTVVKIRANIRNDGMFTILRSIFTRHGLRGFAAGWRLHFLLFPALMINMMLANFVFMKLNKLCFAPKPPDPPPNEDVADDYRPHAGQHGGVYNSDASSAEIREENVGRDVGSNKHSGWFRVNSSFF